MEGSYLSRSVDKPVHFQDRKRSTALDGKLESIKLFVPESGVREIVLVLWFDYWTFKTIDKTHCFGYTFDSIEREGLSSWELSSDLPVQMELRVEGTARELLKDVAGEPLFDMAVAGLTGEDSTSPMRDAANYRYLAVYQQKEFGGATYLKGFKSIYKKQP